jgi:hypothetical protein
VATAVEAVLQRLCVSARNVVVRMEVLEPPPGAAAPQAGVGDWPLRVLVLRLHSAEYGSTSAQAAPAASQRASGAPALRLGKAVRFAGLAVQLDPADGAAAGGGGTVLSGTGGSGCSGTAELTFSSAREAHAQPQVAVSVSLEPVELWLTAEQVAALALIARAAAWHAAQAAHSEVAEAPSGMAERWDGRASILQDLMLPDGQQLVTEALEELESCDKVKPVH